MSAHIAEKRPTGTAVATVGNRALSVTLDMSNRFGMEAAAFESTLRATVVPANCSREDFAAFLLVARDYGLNPITKEIYAFPKRGGGIQPIVSIDGWMAMINRRPELDGIAFEDRFNDEGELVAITCRIYRKDRQHPIEVTEYMDECERETDTWKKWPARMLRHKAAIQCARYAFGISGLQDPDEYERMEPHVVQDPPPRPTRETVRQERPQHAAHEELPPAQPEASAGVEKPETPAEGSAEPQNSESEDSETLLMQMMEDLEVQQDAAGVDMIIDHYTSAARKLLPAHRTRWADACASRKRALGKKAK